MESEKRNSRGVVPGFGSCAHVVSCWGPGVSEAVCKMFP